MARGKSITRELVAEKAIQMARQNGIDHVTYNQLARELGIRPQSLYRYAANIREVHIMIMRTFLSEMIDDLEESLQGKSPIDVLDSFSTELYDLSRQKPWYYESLDLMHQYDTAVEMEGLLNRLTILVRTPIAVLKPRETDRYTQLFLAVTIGYAHMGFRNLPLPLLRGSRNTYLRSMHEFIQKIFQED